MARKVTHYESLEGEIAKEYVGDAMDVEKHTSPTACAILMATLLENVLMTLLAKFFIKSTTADAMFGTRGALDTFAKCTDVAYSLGLFPTHVFNNLKTIGEIRNLFAHNVKVIDFSQKDVANKCQALKLNRKIILLPDDNQDRFVEVCRFTASNLAQLARSIERRKEMKGPMPW